MAKITLSQGKEALVDPEDALLADSTWFAVKHFRTWYAVRKIPAGVGKQANERLHRVIWARAHPGEPVPLRLDHVNGDGLDCRRSNLRPATAAENSRNAPTRLNNRCGFKGVHRHARGRLWRSQIRVDSKLVHLGLFPTAEEAARAYDAAARELHGDFACVNFPAGSERAARQPMDGG